MDDHLRRRGTTMTMDDNESDEVIATGNPVKFSRHAERDTPFLAGIGEHTHEVLEQHGFTEEMIDVLRSKGVVE